MNQRLSIALAPVSGCSLDDTGNIQADSSVLKLRLDGVAETVVSAWRHTRVTLEFNISSTLPLRRLHAEFFWQNVFVKKIELNPFGKNCINIPLYDFRLPSILVIKILDIQDINVLRYVKKGAVSIKMLSVYAEQVTDLLGMRRCLVAGASTLAADLGLTANCLDHERSELLEAKIIKALNGSCGFSAIRLGDGEGRVLAYPDHFSDQEVLEQVLHYQFGPESMREAQVRYGDDWISSSMKILRPLLVDSIKQADVLGLPIVEYFSDNLSDRMGQIAYACALFYGISLTSGLDKGSYFGTNVFQSAAMNRQIFRSITTCAERVILVGPWDLREPLAESFKRRDLRHIKVAGHYSWRGHKGIGQYPDLYRDVEDEIVNMGDLSHALFLVGAGILGKHYCNLIKSRNGVALDIGSVFDSWAKKGRPEAANDQRIQISQM